MDSHEEEEESGPEDVRPPTKLFTLPSGNPVRFFFHDSLTEGTKASAKQKIEKHGGAVTHSRKSAQIILFSETRTKIPGNMLRLHYDVHDNPLLRNIYVEPLSFLTGCIKSRHFKLGGTRSVIKKGMPGKPGGNRPKMPFTDDDDERLCRYLATRIPYKKSGGRAGNNLYKDLEKLGHDPNSPDESYSWAKRHPWQSWRNRYMKNQEVMDERIADWAKRCRREDGKGEYVLMKKPKRKIRRGTDDSDSPEPEDEDDEEEDEERGNTEDEEDEILPTDEEEEEAEELVTKKRKDTGVAEVSNERIGAKKTRVYVEIPNKGKGKERHVSATPFEDGAAVYNGDYEDNTHFDPSEPGPSNTQRSPSAPPPWQQNRERQAPTSPEAAPAPTQEVMMSSQVTLVPTQIPLRGQARTGATQASPLRNAVHHSRLDVNAGTGAEAKKKKDSGPDIPTRSRVARKTASKLVRDPAPVPDPSPAPYRNTRARSRSLEPSVVSVKKEAAKKKAAVLNLVAEDQDPNPDPVATEADGHIVEDDTNIAPQSLGGTVEEEDVVGDMLLGDDLSGNDASAHTAEPEDDAQIRRALEHPDFAGGGHTEESDSDSDDLDAEMQIKLRGVNTPNTKPQPSAGSNIAWSARFQTLKQVDLASRRPVIQNSVTGTPRRDLRPTPLTALEQANLFPSPGTKASEVKERKDREAKSTPYIPAEGTRASAYRTKLR